MSTGRILLDWFDRVFGHAEALILLALIALALIFLLTLGAYIAPLLAGLIVAFALNGVVNRLMSWRVPQILAILIVIALFVGAFVALVIGILPLVSSQLQNFVEQLPKAVVAIQEFLQELATSNPLLVPDALLTTINQSAQEQLTNLGGQLVQQIFQQLPNIVGVLLFLILVPIALFFFLKDQKVLMGYFKSILPESRPLLDQVGRETLEQMANYVRGKLLEILIVGLVCYVVFSFLGLQFALLLSLLVGLSVIIPFVGAAVVTLPVLAVGLIQFGWSIDFLWLVVSYVVIQVLDGNVLVPLLFSETNDLHPIVIIVSVLTFGGLWGIWGVFFAIPLATFIRAIIHGWPTKNKISKVESTP